ncbi:TPA: alanine--tRNA ligase [candidate division CPR2 bacterium]|uniref:Alanine--tRNA ligase n=1 Tax=candidate division CPR2 bacterium GW2011_GWC1_41_48 TaxID=1618344 RepID=A0A0G0Z6Z3_UNCC2|nr:MAG: Alanine-tRNA ligase [candidate division CPR2 bacterium GW2011_GWC2_39_35]KKR27830.1 MAG: Alanine-tRNA ligase [candidate division CPR2 bacterium GW2011_GWD2_39_7]KKS08793.1 MAG: Alanine-tRNA ligase [candidate division CPR2 bacterium GW2011_GWC1_41_48]OGB71906.1 MAG: hypothetical protein A2Y26_02045 [candidate division CPR2 bacterium GWD2_39_7]HBG81278.1 alanine--tRNA ligase [candidate division CPR2 bacterium]
MNARELREKFIIFFESKGHKILPSSSLIPKDDPSVLLTTAGMQQFKNWFAGNEEPKYHRVATVQKSFRTSDIEEVGDATHNTFFEMLGNFSFGDYFKEDAIKFAYEFVTKELGFKKERIWVSIFEGDDEVPRDDESEAIWRSLGVIDIREFGREDNFWGPTGLEGPCGPTSEIYADDVEIWNLVFNQYYMTQDKSLIPLKLLGVDTGAGFERTLARIQNKESIYDTDLFNPIILAVEKLSGLKYKEDEEKDRIIRIISDHTRSATFLISDGVRPSNVGRGYVLRRVIRRAVRYGRLININDFSSIIRSVVGVYEGVYDLNIQMVYAVFNEEKDKFLKTLDNGLKVFSRELHVQRDGNIFSGKVAFDLFQTYGFPKEMVEEELEKVGIKLNEAEFEDALVKHQEISKAGMSDKFKGGLAGTGEMETKYHTATHLLHQALRQVLGPEVKQAGSNITAERLRFDFTYPQKMTPEEVKTVENLANEKIKENIPVLCATTTVEWAKKTGALGLFDSKYGDKVTVYTIGEFSKEICGGPHVTNTGELGTFKIKKEESSSAGVRRIKAVLE